MARTRAANPAAEEARPAAVGKLLVEIMWRGKLDKGGREGSVASRDWRRERRDVRQAWERAVARDCGTELRTRVSPSEERYLGEQEAVVWARRSDWERVTEREELVGRLRWGSRLPQYLLSEGSMS